MVSESVLLQKHIDLRKLLRCCVVGIDEVSALWHNETLRASARSRVKHGQRCCSLIIRIIARAPAERKIILAHDNIHWSIEVRSG